MLPIAATSGKLKKAKLSELNNSTNPLQELHPVLFNKPTKNEMRNTESKESILPGWRGDLIHSLEKLHNMRKGKNRQREDVVDKTSI